MSNICPCCDSTDTVGYWDIKENQGDGLMLRVLKTHYPNARKCVDCEHVWWREPLELPDLKTLQVEKVASFAARLAADDALPPPTDLGFGPGSTANDPEMSHDEMLARQDEKLEKLYERFPHWRPGEEKAMSERPWIGRAFGGDIESVERRIAAAFADVNREQLCTWDEMRALYRRERMVNHDPGDEDRSGT